MHKDLFHREVPQSDRPHGVTTLEVGKFGLVFNTPMARTAAGDSDDEVHGLTGSSPTEAFDVSDFPACPEEWMRSKDYDGIPLASYFVAISEGRQLWFSYGAVSSLDHHVAILFSFQGRNPMNLKKVTSDFRLEQYRVNCPIHDIPFEGDRYCATCKYKHPWQNYVATTTGDPNWLDGYRAKDGEIREAYFTADQARSVAKQLGDEDPPPSVAVVFYESVDPKPRPTYQRRGGSAFLGGGSPEFFSAPALDYDGDGLEGTLEGAPVLEKSYRGPRASAPAVRRSAAPAKTNFQVAAGARVAQKFSRDPNELSFWKPRPSGIVVINYTDRDTLEWILRQGRRPEDREGALGGLRVGRPAGHG